MRKTLVIAAREYNAAVRTKAFLISLVLLPVLLGGSFGVQYLLRDKVDTRPKRFAICDLTRGEGLFTTLEAATRKRTETEIRDASGTQLRPEFHLERSVPGSPSTEALNAWRLEQSERVRRGELAGVVEIGPDVDEIAPEWTALPDPFGQAPSAEERLSIRFQAHSHTSRDFTEWLRRTVSDAVQERRCRDRKLSPTEVREVLRPVPLLAKGLSTRDPGNGEVLDGIEANRAASVLLPSGLVMLMFLMIWIGATPLMQGIVEEKMQRIAEVLLGSVRPFPLMMGKLLGTLGVTTTLGSIYLAGAFFAARHYGLTDHLSPSLVFWFLLYQVLGLLLYGSLFVAVGAACSTMQEVQTLMLPVTLIAVMPLFVLTKVVMDPDGTLATTLSLVPTATPMLMVARLSASPGLPWWQPALGAVLVLFASIIAVWAAGRVFRVGLLMQGKGASFRDMARWILRG